MLGKNALMEFEPRLAKAGCKQIKYIPLQNKIPLSQKWVKIANEAEGDSFALCASDDYSPPTGFSFPTKNCLMGTTGSI